jgi:thiol-disulfide isomerase/thioredoxin
MKRTLALSSTLFATLFATLMLLLAPLAVRAQAPPDADSPADVLDQPARAWTFDRWIRTAPLSQAQLRGKVVLLRWWTHGCHYCKSTLPEIEALRTRYGAKGLVVIGVFHPKPQRHVQDRWVVSVADSLGFHGPLAVDERWSTLDRWWLKGHPDRNWTSVSFLMDAKGVVRWVHTGGEYHTSDDPRHRTCDLESKELETKIQELLADPATKPMSAVVPVEPSGRPAAASTR